MPQNRRPSRLVHRDACHPRNVKSRREDVKRVFGHPCSILGLCAVLLNTRIEGFVPFLLPFFGRASVGVRAVHERLIHLVKQFYRTRVSFCPQPDRFMLALHHLRVRHVVCWDSPNCKLDHVTRRAGNNTVAPRLNIACEHVLLGFVLGVQHPFLGVAERFPRLGDIVTPPHKVRRPGSPVNVLQLSVVRRAEHSGLV